MPSVMLALKVRRLPIFELLTCLLSVTKSILNHSKLYIYVTRPNLYSTGQTSNYETIKSLLYY